MNPEQQAILARDFMGMVRAYQNDAAVLEYLEGFAFSLARGLQGVAVVDWDALASICDQRYYSLRQNEPIPLNTALLQQCEQQIQDYLPKTA